MMQTADPLAGLKDIHLPEPISWWPPAPGWWVMAIMLLVAIGFGTFFLMQKLKKNRYRKEGIKELESVLDKANAITAPLFLQEISKIMRRVAIQSYGRDKIASLTGEKWLRFLDKTGKTTEFSKGEGTVLGTTLYQADCELDMAKVHALAQKWIKGHSPC